MKNVGSAIPPSHSYSHRSQGKPAGKDVRLSSTTSKRPWDHKFISDQITALRPGPSKSSSNSSGTLGSASASGNKYLVKTSSGRTFITDGKGKPSSSSSSSNLHSFNHNHHGIIHSNDKDRSKSSSSSNFSSSSTKHKSGKHQSSPSSSSKRPPVTLDSLKLEFPNLLSSVKQAKADNVVASLKGNNEVANISPSKPDASYTMQTENIFLRKYDPIKLLSRLREHCHQPLVRTEPYPGKTNPEKMYFRDPSTVSYVSQSQRKIKKMIKSSRTSTKTVSNSICAKKRTVGAIMIRRKKITPKYTAATFQRTIWSKCRRKPIWDSKVSVKLALDIRRKRVERKYRVSGDRLVTKKPTRQLSPLAPESLTRGVSKNKKAKSDFKCSKRCDDKQHEERIKCPPIPALRSTHFCIQEDPTVIYTINLLRYKRDLQDRMESLETEGIVYKLSTMPSKASTQESSEFLYDNVPLKQQEVKHVLSHQIFILLLHGGFTHTKLRPLEVLADIASHLLTKFAKQLKALTEMEMHDVDHGFPDPMERLLTNEGLGGVHGLREYYKSEILNYSKRMEEQCHSLRRQYAQKVRSITGVSTSTSSNTDEDTGTNGVVAGNCSRSIVVSVSTPKAGSNNTFAIPSSIPLSPGNSVLAEILSTQEEAQQLQHQEPKTPQRNPETTAGHISNNLKEQQKHQQILNAPPPNVVIRPNSMYNNSHQHTQLVLQTLTAIQSPPVKTSQPHLTQLLQRPVSSMQPLSSKKVQGNTNLNQLLQDNISQHGNSQQYSGMLQSTHVQVTSPVMPSPLGSPQDPSKGNTLTIVRSAPNVPSGIVINSDRQLFQTTGHLSSNSPLVNNNSTIDVYSSLSSQISSAPTVTSQRQSNNIISINLGGITNADLDNSLSNRRGNEETVTIHAGSFPPSIKTKEGNSSKNLLRLNFEQTPNNGMDSTILLSSSSNHLDDPDLDPIPIHLLD